MLYLLHFKQPVGDKHHYLGCCAEHRLNARLCEHRAGRGAKLTARAFKQNAGVFLARVFPALGFAQERQLKNAGHFDKLCPFCCPMFASMLTSAYEVPPMEAQPLPQFAAWDWREIDARHHGLAKQRKPDR